MFPGDFLQVLFLVHKWFAIGPCQVRLSVGFFGFLPKKTPWWVTIHESNGLSDVIDANVALIPFVEFTI